MPKSPQAMALGLPRRLAELLVSEGLITQQHLEEVLKAQRETGEKLGAILLGRGFIKEEKLLEFLGRQCGIKYVSLSEVKIAPEAVAVIPEGIARQYMLIPCAKNSTHLTVAVADPLNVVVLDNLKMMTGFEVRAVLASESDIRAAWEKNYKSISSQEVLDEILRQSQGQMSDAEGVEAVSEAMEGVEDVRSLAKSADDAPVIKMVNYILLGAVKVGASDIHIEPFPTETRVRYRVDGILRDQPVLPRHLHSAISTRIKIMSKLNIAEHRLPQDGRMKIKVDTQEVDLRVSVLPCAPGEKIVMRILDSSGLRVDMMQLGFDPEALDIFKKCMDAPYGINLITGPTGSGKSTTLYSALANLNTPDTNIMTVEDPVEYQVQGINQVQCNQKIGLTFAEALRSFLRQDPDVIMVGEIRDLETANIAINAALTGHLVFSTLHTNDAPSAITRLGMMGVEPFLVSAAVLMVEAQRLIRTLCSKCKEPYEIDAAQLTKIGIPEKLLDVHGGQVTLYRGKGCDNCGKGGYRGRAGIYEVLEVTDPIKELILKRASLREVKAAGLKQGMVTLWMSAVRKLLAGATTVEEIIRATTADV